MKLQHIEFADGSNPYICRTEKSFKWMQDHYVLEPVADGFWKATDRIYYKVVGFPDRDNRATFDRNYKSKSGAITAIQKVIKDKKFQCIILRREIEDLRNNDGFNISVSEPVTTWEF